MLCNNFLISMRRRAGSLRRTHQPTRRNRFGDVLRTDERGGRGSDRRAPRTLAQAAAGVLEAAEVTAGSLTASRATAWTPAGRDAGRAADRTAAVRIVAGSRG